MILGVSYHGSHLSEHMAVDMDRMRDVGVRDVILACQENDFKYMTGKAQDGLAIAAERPDSLYTWSWLAGRGTNEASDNPDLVWRAIERLCKKISKEVVR